MKEVIFVLAKFQTAVEVVSYKNKYEGQKGMILDSYFHL
jgi:hypothetical protein